MKIILRAILALAFTVTGVRFIVAATTDPDGIGFVRIAIGVCVFYAAWAIGRPALRSISVRREKA
ncbi:hypothetical protein [Streptomyces sp. NPDC026673]|uniref:hypothetical protein n=1 Tax=Streptomyces sp. NPDC026673 TaxID=3155724 RepID=UPI0033CFCA16